MKTFQEAFLFTNLINELGLLELISIRSLLGELWPTSKLTANRLTATIDYFYH